MRETILHYLPTFYILDAKNNGFLDTEASQIAREEAAKITEEKIKKSLDEYQSALREGLKYSVNTAIEKANKVEEAARKTAEGVSIAEAQKQFSAAKKNNKNQTIFWLGFSLLFTILLLNIIDGMLDAGIPNNLTGRWDLLYYASLRIAKLGIIGGIMAYGYRMFSAHLHMYHHNSHRLYIANCTEALINTAQTAEQRDMILTNLVSVMTNFGSSGIVKGESGDGPNILAVDSISRNIPKSPEP